MEVKPCWVFINPEFPYLAASPDGLIGADATIEVKCPYSKRDLDISSSNSFPFLDFVNGQISLKKSHMYFDQVQGQLIISKRTKCFFVVFTKVSLKVIQISRDDLYCESCLIPKLKCFYDTYYVKYVASKM